mmetsp:Transcript_22231/g.31845  ORF Transcript_22231/g.31845 Transcript_22231/m.31845 type:complete len:127 (-) Transcript_22231:977-1357(-)
MFLSMVRLTRSLSDPKPSIVVSASPSPLTKKAGSVMHMAHTIFAGECDGKRKTIVFQRRLCCFHILVVPFLYFLDRCKDPAITETEFIGGASSDISFLTHITCARLCSWLVLTLLVPLFIFIARFP